MATNDAWQWQTPSTFPPTSFVVSLDAAGTEWIGGPQSAKKASVEISSFPGFPAISTQPVNRGLDAGNDLTLSVAAGGDGTLSYQWFKNGSALAGQTGATLNIAGTTTADAGSYFVRVSNAAGVVDSTTVQVAVHTAAARLVNISTRGFSGVGFENLIPGFVAVGTGGKTVLIRAVGPTLNDLFGLPDVLLDPRLELKEQATGVLLASNDNWGTQDAGLPDATAVAAAMQATGAFDLPPTSTDAALVYTAPVHTNLTAIVSGVGDTTGVVLADVYVVDEAGEPNSRLVNISTRGFVGTGTSVMIPGFFLNQGGTTRLLIRAAGPTWGRIFNLPGVLPNPTLRVRRTSDQSEVAFNDNWEDNGQAAAIATANSQSGAFNLDAGAADAALILVIPPAVPGVSDRGFTVEISDPSGATGLALAEIYELP